MNFDLNDFNATNESKRCALTNPVNGADLFHDGQPVVILVRGPEHPDMLKHERAISNKRLKAASRTGRVSMTVQEVEAETIARLGACITGWENIFSGGQAVEYSAAAAREMMEKYSWMRDQVDAFYRDAGNFLKSSEATSKTD